MQNQAFTLIELLIVVAIIGILAAIAISNFLQSQVRSKVAHVQESQRNLGFALELYRIDNGFYPPGLNPFIDLSQITETWRVTTPVAYLKRFPLEMFYTPQSFGLPGGDFGPGGFYMHYVSDPIITEFWLMWSYGPDQDMEFRQVHYDPSNGTASDGDIYRVGVQK